MWVASKGHAEVVCELLKVPGTGVKINYAFLWFFLNLRLYIGLEVEESQ